MKVVAIMFVLLGVSQALLADHKSITLDKDGIIVTGTGCKKFDKFGTGDGDVQATVNEDGTALSILFNAYVAEAGGMTEMGAPRPNNARKTCNMRVPVKVPSGYSVSLIQVDYRGFNSLPEGGRSVFSAEYFFAGMRGPRAMRNFPNSAEDGRVDSDTGRLDKEFFIQNKLQATAANWSPCGRPVTLAINTWTQVFSNSGLEDSSISVDSADITTKTPIVYRLTYRTCTE